MVFLSLFMWLWFLFIYWVNFFSLNSCSFTLVFFIEFLVYLCHLFF